ncbi:MAG: leucine-rich repeat protein, partial [Clostridia bacterium]|nr:leucine-rich repeat protein [Clostridia bacterium]
GVSVSAATSCSQEFSGLDSALPVGTTKYYKVNAVDADDGSVKTVYLKAVKLYSGLSVYESSDYESLKTVSDSSVNFGGSWTFDSGPDVETWTISIRSYGYYSSIESLSPLFVMPNDARLNIGDDTAINYGEIEQSSGEGWSIEETENGIMLNLDDLELETVDNDCIFATYLDLTITGSTKLTATGDYKCAVCAIGCNLKLNGNFILRSDSGISLYVSGNLTVDGGSLNTISTDINAVKTVGEITVNTGSVYAESSSDIAIFSGDIMTVNGGSVYAKTESTENDYAINAYRLTLNNGETFALGDENAKEVFICSVGSTFFYGTYPQSKVSDEDLLAALNDLAPENFDDWTSYGYYYSDSGDTLDGEMKPGDFMRYYDALLDGVKYRAVKFTAYRPYFTDYDCSADSSYQDYNDYFTDTVYWFRFEPVDWRVLDPSEGLILCESAIDSQAYNNYILMEYDDNSGIAEYYGNEGKTYYATDYAESSIREWLNDDFINTAFSASQQENIKETELNNDAYSESYSQYNSAQTNDKIFILSYAEATNTAYGFNSEALAEDPARKTAPTDYALCQGIYKDYGGNSPWRLRTPGIESDCSCMVNFDGHVYSNFTTNSTEYGICPAMRLDELKSDPTGAELGLREGDFIYTVSNGKATIIGYTAEDTEENNVITVPATLGGYPVAAIQGHVFKGRYYLSNLAIEGDIESIGPSAFECCSNLREVIFEGDVGSIGDSAFKDCDILDTVIFKGGLEAIGENAFYRCPLYFCFSIPDGVETIGKNAFNGSGLKEVYIPASVKTIAEGAFNTPRLTDVYYGSDAEDWNAINISETNNDPLFDAAMHFNISFFHETKELDVSSSPANATAADKVTLYIYADGDQTGNPLTVFIYDAAGNVLFRNEAVAFERYLSNFNISIASWELDLLDPGYYTAFAEYYENSDGKIYRYTGECSFSVKGIGLTCSDITYGETAEISAKLLPDAQGTVTF